MKSSLCGMICSRIQAAVSRPRLYLNALCGYSAAATISIIGGLLLSTMAMKPSPPAAVLHPCLVSIRSYFCAGFAGQLAWLKDAKPPTTPLGKPLPVSPAIVNG